jgi:hypothetical protein
VADVGEGLVGCGRRAEKEVVLIAQEVADRKQEFLGLKEVKKSGNMSK